MIKSVVENGDRVDSSDSDEEVENMPVLTDENCAYVEDSMLGEVLVSVDSVMITGMLLLTVSSVDEKPVLPMLPVVAVEKVAMVGVVPDSVVAVLSLPSVVCSLVVLPAVLPSEVLAVVALVPVVLLLSVPTMIRMLPSVLPVAASVLLLLLLRPVVPVVKVGADSVVSPFAAEAVVDVSVPLLVWLLTPEEEAELLISEVSVAMLAVDSLLAVLPVLSDTLDCSLPVPPPSRRRRRRQAQQAASSRVCRRALGALGARRAVSRQPAWPQTPRRRRAAARAPRAR